MADLISSEAVGGRFHPSSLGFHPAEQDFIKITKLAGIVFVLASFFVFSREIQIVHSPFVGFMGYRSIIDLFVKILDFGWVLWYNKLG